MTKTPADSSLVCADWTATLDIAPSWYVSSSPVPKQTLPLCVFLLAILVERPRTDNLSLNPKTLCSSKGEGKGLRKLLLLFGCLVIWEKGLPSHHPSNPNSLCKYGQKDLFKVIIIIEYLSHICVSLKLIFDNCISHCAHPATALIYPVGHTNLLLS